MCTHHVPYAINQTWCTLLPVNVYTCPYICVDLLSLFLPDQEFAGYQLVSLGFLVKFPQELSGQRLAAQSRAIQNGIK